MPPIYSDMSFSSLLSLFIMPEKNWIGQSRGCDCTNLCTFQCHKKASPLGVQETLVAPSDILRVPHSHRTSGKLSLNSGLDLLIQTPYHLLIHTNVTTFTWCSLFHNAVGLRTHWSIRYFRQMPGYLPHWNCSISEARMKNLLIKPDALLLITIHQNYSNSLNPSAGWTGNTCQQTHAHIHTSSIHPSKSQSPNSISKYASISL